MKLVHIGEVDLIPDDTVLVRYEVADDVAIEDVRIEDLPTGWRLDEGASRAIAMTGSTAPHRACCAYPR